MGNTMSQLRIYCNALYRYGSNKQAQIIPSNKPNARSAMSRNSSHRDRYPGGKLSVYFGSQTGTAESFARTIAAETRTLGFDSKLIDLGDFDPAELCKCRLAIFVVATYGEGDPTDNAMTFYEWLCNKDGALSSDFLRPLNYTVFALGNSTYEHFCGMGKKTDSKLADLGASRTFPLGIGDDNGTLDEDFENWKGGFIPFLKTKYLSSSAPENSFQIPAPTAAPVHLTYNLIPAEKLSSANQQKGIENRPSKSSQYFFFSSPIKLINRKELRSSEDKGHTIFLDFDISVSGLSYVTADTLSILVDNAPDDIQTMATICHQMNNLDTLVKIDPIIEELFDDDEEEDNEEDNEDGNINRGLLAPKPEDVKSEFKHPFPNPCTVRTILSQYLAIGDIPRKSNLERLLSYITNPEQRKWLANLLMKENRELYVTTIEKEGRSYASLFRNELSSCDITLSELAHVIPLMHPRMYTISSSSSCYPSNIHLTVSVLETQSPTGQTIRGQCSHFLHHLPLQTTCRAFVKSSTFALPPSILTPIIMIGPGSGIAPMRALLQERQYRITAAKINPKDSENILFFGCKSKKLDFLYQDEFEGALSQGTLSAFWVAFSRDQEKKVYVQDLIADPEIGMRLARVLMEKNGYIYVCGGSGIGAGIMNVLTDVIAKYKGIDNEEAGKIIKTMQKEKRYVQELWST